MRKIADKWLRDVLSLLYRRKTLTRGEMVEATRLNVASVSRTLGQLLRCGTVIRVGELESSGGRKPDLFELNGDAGYFVAIDLAATRIRFGIVDLGGDIRHWWEEEVEFGQKLETLRLIDGVRRILRCLTVKERGRVLSVGISCPGIIEEDAITAVNLGWRRFPLVRAMRQAIRLPITLEQDYRIGVFAEHWLGSAQNVQNCLYVIIGDGIGVGSIVDGHVLEGRGGMAGEFGHITIDRQAEDPCNCGKTGCLEAISSGPHIVRQYLERLGQRAARKPQMRVVEVFERARSGDAAATAVIDRAARHLGWGLSHLVNVMNPELILLGGDIVDGSDLILPIINEELRQLCLPALVRDLRVQVSSLGPDIGLKGAALVAFRSLLSNSSLLKRLVCLQPSPSKSESADHLALPAIAE